MFGSVSSLILKAENPPYKVATQQGAMEFNSLTGAVLAIIESQREEPNVGNLRRINPKVQESANERDDADFTFSNDEGISSRSSNRIRRGRVSTPDVSAIELNSMIARTSAGDMYVADVRRSLGESLLQRSAQSMPSGRGRSDAVERAVLSDYQEALNLLTQMRSDAEHGRYDNAESSNRYTNIMRRVWTQLSKDQVSQLTLKTRGVVGSALINRSMSTALINRLRKWMYVMIIRQITMTEAWQTSLYNLREEYVSERTYWQGLLQGDIIDYSNDEARRVSQHNMGDAINHLTYVLSLLQGLSSNPSLLSVRELASCLVTNDHVRWIEDLFFSWIHGHSNIQVAQRGLVSLVGLLSVPSEVFTGGSMVQVHHRHLPVRVRSATSIVMLIRMRAMLSEKVKMTLACSQTSDILAFSYNAIGNPSGHCLLRTMREMIIRTEPNEQDNILCGLWSELMRSVERYNDCHITRYRNPMEG